VQILNLSSGQIAVKIVNRVKMSQRLYTDTLRSSEVLSFGRTVFGYIVLKRLASANTTLIILFVRNKKRFRSLIYFIEPYVVR